MLPPISALLMLKCRFSRLREACAELTAEPGVPPALAAADDDLHRHCTSTKHIAVVRVQAIRNRKVHLTTGQRRADIATLKSR